MIAILRFSEEHQDLRANQPAQQHPQTEVIDPLAWQAVTLCQPRCDQDGAQKRDGEKDAISVDGETADANDFGIHKSTSRRSATKNEIVSEQQGADGDAGVGYVECGPVI